MRFPLVALGAAGADAAEGLLRAQRACCAAAILARDSAETKRLPVFPAFAGLAEAVASGADLTAGDELLPPLMMAFNLSFKDSISSAMERACFSWEMDGVVLGIGGEL